MAMLQLPRPQFRASPEYQPVLHALGLSAEAVFTHPKIKVWRSIPERQNCTLDGTRPDGSPIRLHIKRYQPARGFTTPADDEARGIRALQIEHIPTAPLVGWGKLVDGRSFVITEDLTGYRPADNLIKEGFAFETLLNLTADLAAKLHQGGLHHRDLYLCHFFIRQDVKQLDVKLIDAARVKRLPGWPFRNRWIVKDLAQFHYSATRLSITAKRLAMWLARYAEQRGLESTASLARAIERKSKWIETHDAKLNQKQPTRNVSIPGT